MGIGAHCSGMSSGGPGSGGIGFVWLGCRALFLSSLVGLRSVGLSCVELGSAVLVLVLTGSVGLGCMGLGSAVLSLDLYSSSLPGFSKALACTGSGWDSWLDFGVVVADSP